MRVDIGKFKTFGGGGRRIKSELGFQWSNSSVPIVGNQSLLTESEVSRINASKAELVEVVNNLKATERDVRLEAVLQQVPEARSRRHSSLGDNHLHGVSAGMIFLVAAFMVLSWKFRGMTSGRREVRKVTAGEALLVNRAVE